MAFRIPSFADLPEVNPRPSGTQPVYPAEDPGAAALTAFGKGVSAVGGSLANIAADREDARQKLNESNATLDLVNRYVPLHTQISTETDPNKIAELRQQYDSMVQTSAAAIDDPARKAAWMASHAKTILSAHGDADKRLTLLDRERVAVDGQGRRDLAVRNGVLAEGPDVIAGTLAELKNNLDWQEKYGSLSPAERYTREKRETQQLLAGRANHLLNTGRPNEAERLLKDYPAEIDPSVAEPLWHKIGVAKEKQGVAADIAAETGAGIRDKGYAGERAGHINYGNTGALGDPRKPGWEAENLTAVSSPSGAKFKVHKAAAADFSGFLKDLEDTGYMIKPDKSGGHNLREMRGGSGQLSEHSYGTALDINSDSNLYTKDGRKVTDLPPQVAALAAKHNLDWGGNWKDPIDTMHFQWRGPRAATADNNLGGIRRRGVIASKAEGGFESYDTPEAGVQAIASNLRRYAEGGVVTASNPEGKPLNTLRGIVSTWAPPNENDTPTLIERAAKTTGFEPDQVIDLKDPATLAKMVEATIRNEQGGKLPVSRSLIAQAASGSATPPDQPAAGQPPMFDAQASMQRTQARADRGEISQERANAVNAGVLGWHNQVQARQANERAAVTKRLSNGAVMLEDGRDFDYDPAEVRHFFPKEKADEFLTVLQDAKESGQIMNGVRMASQSDLVRQEREITGGLADPNAENYARRRKHATAFYAAVEKRRKAIDNDPAGYVAQFSPEVSTKYAAISQAAPEQRSAFFANYAATALSEQERLGVAPENRSVLPAGEAAQVASRISGLDPAKEDPAKALAGLASYYGDYWEPAFGDLVKAKLPGAYQVLATMTEKDQVVPAADLSRAIKLVSEKGGMGALKKLIDPADKKEIDVEVRTALENFRLSTGEQSGGPRLAATVSDATTSLAYYYAYRGHGYSEAARLAVAGIIGAKYDFGKIGAGQVRVPKGSLAIVERATEAMRASFTVDQLGDIPGNEIYTPDQRKELWMGAIRDGGWVNNRDDTGIVLMGRFRNGAFHAVRRADGSRIEVSFANAPLLAKEAPDVPVAVEEGVQRLHRGRSPAPGSTVLGASDPGFSPEGVRSRPTPDISGWVPRAGDALWELLGADIHRNRTRDK